MSGLFKSDGTNTSISAESTSGAVSLQQVRVGAKGCLAAALAASQTVTGSGTITVDTTSKNYYLTTGGAVTGVILSAGTIDGQECVLVNTSANSITFATAATSNVADGTSAVIAANTRMSLTWSQTAARWYHGN
jgi:hypothetical protein